MAAEPGGGPGRSVDQAQPVGAGGGFNAVVDVELMEDVADVDADRLGAQEQQLGDLPVSAAVRQVTEDLQFAGCQVDGQRL